MRKLLPAFAALVVIACASTPSNTTLPRIMRDTEADYPDFVPNAQARGNDTVEIEAVIDTGGAVNDPRVLSSPDHRLDDAALSTARFFVFKPGTVDGAPADMLYQFSVHFRRRGF